MTAQTELLARITLAEGHIRNARHAWDPSSISASAECAEHLQQAIAEMNAACQAASNGPAAPGASQRLARLRSDVEVLSRLVDAAIAFGRGLALRTGGEESVCSEVRG